MIRLVLTVTLTFASVAQAAEPVDVAAFGTRRVEEVTGKRYAIVEWDEPRDIRRVVVKGAAAEGVEYWQSVWPDNGTGGWQRLDDPFHGRWVQARGTAENQDGGRLTFAPLGREELPEVKELGAPYRRTYRLRVASRGTGEAPTVEAYSDAVWRRCTLRLEWKPRAGGGSFDGTIEAGNGRMLTTQAEGNATRVEGEFAMSGNRLSPDRGYLILRPRKEPPFSVFVDDVSREGGIYIRDIDAFVSDASTAVRFKGFAAPGPHWDKTVLERVPAMPEQTFEHAMAAMPRKQPPDAPLGVPNLRQEFLLNGRGEIFLKRESLRSPGKDMDRRPWNGSQVHYAIATGVRPDPGNRHVTRSLEEGWLPVMQMTWESDGVSYRQSSFATVLLGEITDAEYHMRGDESVVLCNRIEMQNPGPMEREASVWLEISSTGRMRLADDGMLLLEKPSDDKEHPGLTPVRGRIDTHKTGQLTLIPDFHPEGERPKGEPPRQVIHCTLRIPPGGKQAIDLTLPYVELLEPAELDALRTMAFAPQHDKVVSYWKRRIAEGMTFEVPDPTLAALFKANLWHILISTDRDPPTGLYEHGAATMHYGNYPNETCMVIQSLEMRGEHREAAMLLEPYLASQGTKPLPGNFKSKEGVFYSAYPTEGKDPYTAQGYNMHHGWILWTLAEHYRWTGDRPWLERVAPKLVTGCDWIIKERQATRKVKANGRRCVEWGLLPAGDLEDVDEYLYWYATNAYHWAGLVASARVLGEIGHPEAARLAKEADAYRADILASLTEAVAHAPAVRLQDGSYVPYVPQRVGARTHRKEGWIREALYPALHLADAGVLPADHPFITWQLQDLEDNLFLSAESGYRIKDLDAKWFDFGGFTMQPNLLPNATIHLQRGETAAFLRSVFNMGAASLYPDVMCFAEWVPEFGQGAGPLYKTPDESKFIQFLRDMVVFEDEEGLKLAGAIPQAWMKDGMRIRVERAATTLGPVNLEITSKANQGKVIAEVSLPERAATAKVALRLRHPDGRAIRSVLANGKPVSEVHGEWIPLPPGVQQLTIEADFDQ